MPNSGRAIRSRQPMVGRLGWPEPISEQGILNPFNYRRGDTKCIPRDSVVDAGPTFQLSVSTGASYLEDRCRAEAVNASHRRRG